MFPRAGLQRRAPALLVPGFSFLAAADASVQAVRSAYAGELFPTEVRGTLGAVLVLALLAAASALLLRPLLETAGTDVLSAPTPLEVP